VILVTQTPDYLLPASSCTIQGRLRLANTCAAFDVNLGCSGYVYGLWLAAGLIASKAVGRVLLLAGDTISKIVSPSDRSVALLFGDAGSATALEYDSDAPPMDLFWGLTAKATITLSCAPAVSNPPASRPGQLSDERRRKSRVHSQRSAQLLRVVLDAAGWDVQTPDAYVLHQANRLILNSIIDGANLDQVEGSNDP